MIIIILKAITMKIILPGKENIKEFKVHWELSV